jgi:hypothetical protein
LVSGTSTHTTDASTTRVVTAHQQLQQIEARFRVTNFLHLPVRHCTEQRVRGHIAICVYASILEALIAADLHAADVRDPDLDHQHLTCARALRELARIRAVTLDVGGRTTNVITRPTPLQSRILHALHVETHRWDRAKSPDPPSTLTRPCSGNTIPRAPTHQAQRDTPAELGSDRKGYGYARGPRPQSSATSPSTETEKSWSPYFSIITACSGTTVDV